MDKLDILRQLNLGGTVAEHDALLAACYVRHPVMQELVQDRCDLVLGAKGAGKSAVWRIIKELQPKIPELADVQFRLVTNPSGDPEFRDVLAAIHGDEFPDDDSMRVGWRLYLLAQFWIAARAFMADKAQAAEIERKLRRFGILPSHSGGLKQAFSYAIAKAQTLKKVSVKWVKAGLAMEFDHAELQAGESAAAIPFNDLLEEIALAVAAEGFRVWLLLDRLDEIVLGDEERENVVLKGLLLGCRDLSDRRELRVKVFLRDDVFDRVTDAGHFPALTHIRARSSRPIRWGLDELLHLVVRRLLANESIRSMLQVKESDINDSETRRLLFYSLFPTMIDKGRAAEGFKWIIDRISDGNKVATPRDLLTTLDHARVIQINDAELEGLKLPKDELFSEDAIRKAVKEAAKANLETRIYAEYPDLKPIILKFHGQKADHNPETLQAILGKDWERWVKRLHRVGFIYQRSRKGADMWTIPFFYSFALDVRRGAAFDLPGDDEAE